MTQSDVARVLELEHDLKLHPTAIAKMEQRDAERPRAIRLFEAQAIADLFGLTVDEMTSPADSEIDALSRDFAQIGAKAEQLRAETADLFDRMRAYAPLMAVPEDQATPALRESRKRIIRALAALEETDRTRQEKARALLDEVTESTFDTQDVSPETQHALREFGQHLRAAREAAGLKSTAEIAKQMGVQPAVRDRMASTFDEMERGEFRRLELSAAKQAARVEGEPLEAVHAYIRAYSAYVGLDPMEQVARYEMTKAGSIEEKEKPARRVVVRRKKREN